MYKMRARTGTKSAKPMKATDCENEVIKHVVNETHRTTQTVAFMTS